MIFTILNKSMRYYTKRHNSRWGKLSLEEQKKYLARFNEPIDNIERSYYQYKCHMKLYGFFMSFLLNIISFPLVIYYFYKFSKKDKCFKSENVKEPFCIFVGKNEKVLPNSIMDKYKIIKSSYDGNKMLLKQDREYIKNIIKKYPFDCYFVLRIIWWISIYRWFIEFYSPEAIIGCIEYGFYSSVLTDFCEKNNVKHINVMHGEKLYCIRESFFHFHECYVWDEHYVRLFKELRAEQKQFIIELPKALIFDDKYKNQEKEYDFTYYLMSEMSNELQKINALLEKIKYRYSAKVSIRPHPLYSNIKEIRKIFTKIQIENNSELPIEKSIMRTKNVIAVYSTVLYQAYYNGVNIIIDDLSQKYKYQKLEELKYIFTLIKCDKLSNLL